MAEALDARKQQVLKTVVERFIRDAEPVSSRTVAQSFPEPVSSATVRNEMAALMEMGYLAQTHTSSGRVPTDIGYRYYIDHLARGSVGLSEREIQIIRESLDIMQFRLQTLVRSICETLSDYTSMVTVASMPSVEECTITHIELGRVASRHCLIVVMLSTGEVIDRLVRLPFELSTLDATAVSRRLASQMTGRRISALKGAELDTVLTRAEVREIELRIALKQFIADVDKEKMNRLQVSGRREILSQPEFRDLSQFKDLMQVLDDTEAVSRLIQSTENDIEGGVGPSVKVTVRIGSENPIEALSDYSFISCPYSAEVIRMEGRVGLLGPKRMNYLKLMELIQFTASRLGEKLRSFDFLNA